MGIAAVAAFTIGATGAGAATIHRYAVNTATGSGGATAFTQTSASGSALQGEVASSTRTNINVPFGVLGEYDATGSTFGIGVAGISTTGYAVGAEALGGNPAIIALGKGTGDGLEAYSSNSLTTLYAENQGTGAAVQAVGDQNDGADGYTFADEGAALLGDESAPDYGFGVFGEDESPAGVGAIGYSTSGEGVVAESSSGNTSSPALAASTSNTGTDLIQGVINSGTDVYENFSVGSTSQNASGTVITTASSADGDVQANGDLYLSGSVFTGCATLFPASASNCTNSALASVARTSNGAMLTTYTSRHASATMEDEGEAKLVDGAAHVALDPAFASTISTAQPYLVFTTPRGDNRGLYVTHVTASGFDVRESSGGHSTLAFDYRIVAHPYGDRSQRLAAVSPNRSAGSRPIARPAMANAFRMMKARSKAKFVRHAAPRSIVSLVK